MVALGMVVAAGCHEDGSGGSDMAVAHLPPQITPLYKCTAPPRPSSAAAVALVPAFPNLPALSVPVGIAQAPGDADSFYVWQQSGKLVRIAAADPTSASTVIDLSATANKLSYGAGENGLLGLAFSPNWQSNHTAYLSYNTPSAAAAGFDTVVSRIVSNDNGATFDLSTEKVLLQWGKPYPNHNGGNLLFGHDGYLYAGWGDGGSGGDPGNRAQDLTVPYGKIMRLDVEGQATYAIPPTNPFASSTNLYTQLIYAYGVRNPWRWSFDRDTGDLWVGDVGQDLYEEVDKIKIGGNYGWHVMEGTHCYNAATCTLAGALPPEVDYGHADADGGPCVTGGYVYHGKAIPSLVGSYIFGDYGSGRLWRLTYDANGVGQKELLVETGKNISSFGEGADGELYLISYGDGVIYKLVAGPTQPGPAFPPLLSATGCIDPQSLAGAGNTIEYDVNMPLWSDGADKRRWLSLPDGAQIHVNADGDWDLPAGTVLMKEFSVGGQRVETRLFVHHDDGDWAGYSYEWLPDQSDAVLLSAAKTKVLGNGQSWYFPSRNDCLRCHTVAAGRSLGLETAQMNRDAPDGSGNQLDELDGMGLFDAPLGAAPAMLPSFPQMDDANAPVTDKARAYLHANCSFCHRMGGPGRVPPDWRDSLTLAQTGACNATPQDGDLGVMGAMVVAPGMPAASVTSLRMRALDANRMPPLASHVVDAAGTGLIDAWISSLTGCQ
jgi:uncharacterized repeat protein (TIGR03806 family)